MARFTELPGSGGDKPALVALEQTRNCTVNAGNGTIHAFATTNQPGLIYTDSDGFGANCSGGGNTVFNGGNSGNIWADPSVVGDVGELGYFAATQTDAFASQPSYDENGALPPPAADKVKLANRITRSPVDKLYHCGNLTPVPATCVTSGAGINDYIKDAHNKYASNATAPTGFTTFPGVAVAGTCSDPPAIFPPGNDWYIDCPLFSVIHPVTFQDRNIVFNGNVEIVSGGDLTINLLNAATVAPAGDDAIVVVRGTNGINTTSNTWGLHWYRTVVLMDNSACTATIASCGRLDISNGVGAWTAPTEGNFKDLIYWTETSQPHSFQGNPLFTWAGIFVAANSLFQLQGNVIVDARNVQLWVNSVDVQNNSAALYLRPDPARSVSVPTQGSALIR